MLKRKKKTSLRMRREEEGWAVTSLKGGEGRAVGEDYRGGGERWVKTSQREGEGRGVGEDYAEGRRRKRGGCGTTLERRRKSDGCGLP